LPTTIRPPVHWLPLAPMVTAPLPPKLPLARVKLPVTESGLLTVMVPPQVLSICSTPMALVKPASTVEVKSLTLELLLNRTVCPAVGGVPNDQLPPSLQLVSTAKLAPVHWSTTATPGSSKTAPRLAAEVDLFEFEPATPPQTVVPYKLPPPSRSR